MISTFATLYNESFSFGTFPNCFKTAKKLYISQTATESVLKSNILFLPYFFYYSARTMFVNTYQDNIDVLNRKQCNSFKNRLQCSDNQIISAIVNSYPFEMPKLNARWRMNTEIVRILCKPCLVVSLVYKTKI